jgi:hypothetical protein
MNMAEEWLYAPTLRQMSKQHNASLTSLLPRFRSYISLPTFRPYGTKSIQIDVVAADCKRRLLAIAECKEFVSFQGASECAEQIALKTYLLTTFLKDALGGYPTDGPAGYDVVQYVSLGSRKDSGYANVKTKPDAELEERRDAYSTYLNTMGRKHLGIFLFRDAQTPPMTKPAEVWKWLVRAGSTPGGM